ncbi:hypothetical protein [Planococcus koreensis]|uniref:hypothetical protein n=1 Tax=Planococcus koreensis TaxID=112331 RepID=UPI0039FBDC14
MEKVKTSLLLYGTVNPKKENILSWYQFVYDMSEKLGFPFTHLGIKGDSFKSEKLLTIKRAENRFKKSLERGESIKSLELYSLPEDFTQAIFDYDTLWILDIENDEPFLLMILPKESFNEVNLVETINHLKRYIQFSDGEIFEMAVDDCPAFYAYKMNEPADYKSLKILKKV